MRPVAGAQAGVPKVILRILIMGVTVCGFSLRAWPSTPPTTVIIIRHAERTSFFDTDAPLSSKGRHRAAGLAFLLEKFEPKTLVASNLVRTQQTLLPLSERIHKPLVIWDYRESQGLADHLKSHHKGEHIVVCWHHDHMVELARALGVPGTIPDWSMFTFNKIWIVTMDSSGRTDFQEQVQWAKP